MAGLTSKKAVSSKSPSKKKQLSGNSTTRITKKTSKGTKKVANSKNNKRARKSQRKNTKIKNVRQNVIRIIKHKRYLEMLGNMENTSKHRKLIIHYGEKRDIDAVLDCIRHVLFQFIGVPFSIKQKMLKYKKPLRLLANNRKSSLTQKKKALRQVGGILPFLIPLALKAALPLIIKGAAGGAVGAIASKVLKK